MGGKHVTLNTDTIKSNIPLLLTRKSMKNADMALDFKNDNAMVFGEPIKLRNTKSGHYAIPITPYSTFVNNVNSGINNHVTLIATENSKSKYDIALNIVRKGVPAPPL